MRRWLKEVAADCSETLCSGWLRSRQWADLINCLRTDGHQMRLSIKLFQLDRVHVESRGADETLKIKGTCRSIQRQRTARLGCFYRINVLTQMKSLTCKLKAEQSFLKTFHLLFSFHLFFMCRIKFQCGSVLICDLLEHQIKKISSS